MRQLFVPGRLGAGMAALAGPNVPVMRTLSLSVNDGMQITDALRMEYGFALDAVTFVERMNYLSPYARLIYTLPDESQIQFSYNSGVPRPEEFSSATNAERDLQNDLSALALFPRISMRDSRMQVQQSQNFELGYRRTDGSRTYSVAAFRENIANAAVTIAGADGFFPASDVLPDLFTTSSVFNAGGFQSLGYMASVTQKFGQNLKASILYGSGDALVAGRSEVLSQNPDDLRSMIQRGRRGAVTTQISGSLPRTATEFNASYQWTDRHALTPTHFYTTQDMRAEAGLNIYIRQPIRAFTILPVRMEASADLRNLLAEGYLPFSLSNGQQILLMHTPRSVRGGLSFIF